jgi:hypothetical protein
MQFFLCLLILSVSANSQNTTTAQTQTKTGDIKTTESCSPVNLNTTGPITIRCNTYGLTAKQIQEQREQYTNVLNAIRQSGLKEDQILDVVKRILVDLKSVSDNMRNLSDGELLIFFISGAERGDAHAWDMLYILMQDETKSQGVRDEAQKEYLRVIKKYENTKYVRELIPDLKWQPGEDELIWCLDNGNERLRRQALDTADEKFAKKFLDAIIEVAMYDSSLDVRFAAYQQFLKVTGQDSRNYAFPDKDGFSKWWYDNRSKYVDVSRMVHHFKYR